MGRLRDAWNALTGRSGFEGAQANAQHWSRPPRSQLSPDLAVEWANTNLTLHGRWLDSNDDIAVSVLDDLVTNVVGVGIMVEPKPAPTGREVNSELADQFSDLWEDWQRTPDVTQELPWGEFQRLACRAWLRDGEFFVQHVRENAPYRWEPGEVRYRLEFLESDFCPLNVKQATDGYRQGVYHDAWNRPIAYDIYRTNPYDLISGAPALAGSVEDLKRVSADDLLHIKFARRWPQTRGVPVLHAVIRRLQDLKHYEASERVAARVAASMTAYIKRNPDLVSPVASSVDDNISGERQREFQAGMVWDDLAPGEEIGTIDTNRPNPELTNFRSAMIRAIAGGTGTRYSSVARDFSGTYASQRQELVEAQPHYKRLRNYFIARFVRPVYSEFIAAAWRQGRIQVPSGVALEDLQRAEFIGPGFGWIDPLKEVNAAVAEVEAGFVTREQVIRRTGGDPRMVDSPTRPAVRPVEEPPQEMMDDAEDA